MARVNVQSQDMAEAPGAGATPDGLMELGLRYSLGRDVELDFVEAHKWFNLAALRGNDDAKRYRAELSREMSRRQISEAQRLARQWLSRH